MRRLYQKIYLVFLASLIAVVAISGLSWRMGQANLPHSEVLDFAGELVLAALPPADAPPQAQQRAVERLGRPFPIAVAPVYHTPPPRPPDRRLARRHLSLPRQRMARIPNATVAYKARH